MPKFYILDRIPCFVTFVSEIEADSEEEALELWRDDCAVPIGHIVGTTMDYADAETTVTTERPAVEGRA